MAVTTLPFFGSLRLVIVEVAFTKVDKLKKEKYIKLLESIPESTHLVLQVNDHLKWKRDTNGSWDQNWEILSTTHWLVKWFDMQKNTEIVDLALPDEKNMGSWIGTEAKRQGGLFDPDASRELVSHIGNDTGIASQEIAKLLMYVNFQRPVNSEDVLECVSEEGTADIYQMLDDLMDRQTKQAQSKMRRQLEHTPPEAVFNALVRRFRLLIQMREVLDTQKDPKSLISKGIFVNQINRFASAARTFSMPHLTRIYRRLLDMDIQAKTSQGDLETNLEMFVLELE